MMGKRDVKSGTAGVAGVAGAAGTASVAGAADTASIPKEELAALFREFTTYFDRCRFKPCSHTHEPDCAVKSAVAEGLIAVERYDAYIDMMKNYK